MREVVKNMAEFVKLKNGRYINIDAIITIDEDVDEDQYIAHTLGFDSTWEAHTEELTGPDLNCIMKASRKN